MQETVLLRSRFRQLKLELKTFMKHCPKCQSFYEDANLAFCLADGIPLVEINQSNALWNEGTKAVSHSRQIIAKQMRTQKLIRISKLLVTVLIMIMVISVVAMRIYIYTNPPEKKAEIITSDASAETLPSIVAQASVSRTPKPNDCNCNNNCSVNKTINCGCNKNCDVITTNNCNCNNNCSVNRASKCNCNKNCVVEEECNCNIPCKDLSTDCKEECNCKPPTKCPPEKILSDIRKENYKRWFAIAKEEEKKIKEEFIKEHKIPENIRGQVKVDLNFTEDQINFGSQPNCLKIIITFDYSWELKNDLPIRLNPTPKKKNGSYTCTRDNNESKWECK